MDPLTLKLMEQTGQGGAWRYWWYLHNQLSDWWAQGAPSEPRSTSNVYFGVHPIAIPRAVDQRSTIGTIAAMSCLIAEFDAKDFGGSLPVTRKHVEELRLPPSVCICSGGGYHCYWMLPGPVPVTDANRGQLRHLQYRWVKLVGSDDGAKDLARVLRVPGTWNTKYSPPRPVEFVWYDDATFTLDVLHRHVDQFAPAPARVHPAPAAATYAGDDYRAQAYAQAAMDDELQQLALTPPGARNKALVRAAFSLAQLVASGLLTQHDVIQGLYSTALAIGLTENETRRTIESGYRAGLAQPRSVPRE